MKKRFAASAVLAALVVGSSLPLAAQNWSSCYAGIHIGGAWSKLNITDVGFNGVAFAARGTAGQVFPANSAAIFGGGQAGCDVRSSGAVVGAVFDIGGLGLNASSLDPGTSSNTMLGLASGVYGDVAVRAGMPVHHALLYGKGGWAFFDGKETLSTTSATYASKTDVGLFSGFVAGAGVELRLHSNWTGNVEYAYYGFPSQTFNTVNTAGAVYPFKEKLSLNAVRVGVNYRFSSRRNSVKH